jgi:hypothetical protein
LYFAGLACLWGVCLDHCYLIFLNTDLATLFFLAFGLLGGVIGGSRGRQRTVTNDIQTVEALSWVWQESLKGALIGLLIGSVFVLTGLLFLTIFFELFNNIQVGVVLVVALQIIAICGFLGLLFGGLSSKIIETRIRPNQGVRLSTTYALITGVSFFLIVSLVAGLMLILATEAGGDPLKNSYSWIIGLVIGGGVGITTALWFGGFDVIQHITLYFYLYLTGKVPSNYAHFLDYTVRCIFLQKVGGGYIFIHRVLKEHFAAMGQASTPVK